MHILHGSLINYNVETINGTKIIVFLSGALTQVYSTESTPSCASVVAEYLLLAIYHLLGVDR